MDRFFLQQFSANCLLGFRNNKGNLLVFQIWYMTRQRLFCSENNLKKKKKRKFGGCYSHLYFLTLNAVDCLDWALLVILFHKNKQLMENAFCTKMKISSDVSFLDHAFFIKKIQKPLECSRSFIATVKQNHILSLNIFPLGEWENKSFFPACLSTIKFSLKIFRIFTAHFELHKIASFCLKCFIISSFFVITLSVYCLSQEQATVEIFYTVLIFTPASVVAVVL